MKNAFFKREHLFRRTFLLYCYYDYRGYRLLLLKIICYCMIQSHNRVKACAHLYTHSCLHWYRNSEHILIQQICSHITDICLALWVLFVCYYSWGKICGIVLFLFNGSGPNMNVHCICWVSLFVLSKMPFPADRSVFDFVMRGSCGAHLETLWFALNNDCSGKWPA